MDGWHGDREIGVAAHAVARRDEHEDAARDATQDAIALSSFALSQR